MDNNVVYLLTIIDLRPNEPDAYTSVYRTKEDAIQAGIRYVNDYIHCVNLSNEKIYEELDGGDGINLPDSVYVLPIELTQIK